ncbi:heavy-metal-associated domain-containing protein [Bacillus sp. DX1.1]|uniref:heavy-metal-associated domain-containing protein n=1 Tax=unclassified Bacillus (in: firmicutes) TaxID=185979 RepID=UPI002570019D|nr:MULTISPECIES: heavy-metal-associated domain-containing protein [unclassified Bacillus (in: firmicutes)]MDM5157267.1 heavy-metal-associated domain-containing protein [Bacillus sp. DX1.1]WJE81494.1 heavy-metal-associated domain-containing protein [Bacillus sp. DX3.1]
MSTIQLALNDVACIGCIGKIKRKMKKYCGVEQVKIISGSGKMEINFNENIIQPEEIDDKIQKLAFRIFD